MTGVNFVLIPTATVLEGSATVAGPSILALASDQANEVVAGGGGTMIDKDSTSGVGGLAGAGFAKNNAISLTLTGTTAITFSLIALAAATGLVIGPGDTVFAAWSRLRFKNIGTTDLKISPGASNGNALGLGGTSPTITVPAGSSHELNNAAGNTVDSSHTNVTVTPTSGGSLVVSIGGS